MACITRLTTRKPTLLSITSIPNCNPNNSLAASHPCKSHQTDTNHLIINFGTLTMKDQLLPLLVEPDELEAHLGENRLVIVDLSSANHPMSINFLPENHISVLPASRIVATYEDFWDRMRDTFGSGQMPRSTVWITGPSRTADVGQQMLFGAHGPVREHIIIVEGA